MKGSGLEVGVDRTDITPLGAVPLAGFAAREGQKPAGEVLAPLHVRAMAIRSGGEPPVVLVTADLLWWGDDIVASLRSAFSARFGLSPESLVLHATHTHSGPQASRGMAPSLGVPDDGYLDRLEQQTLACIERALITSTPVRVETARVGAGLTVDRRWARTAGEIPVSPIDSDLTVVRLVGEDEAAVALLVHFACHPVLHHGNAVTPDVAGTLADVLERDTSPFVMYLQGCCGDVNPDRYEADGEFVNGGQADVEDFARHLAELARGAVADAAPAGPGAVSISRRSVVLPLQDRAPWQRVIAWAAADGVRAEWARMMLADPARFARDPRLQLVRIGLTRDLSLLGLSGEPVSHYGLFTRELSGGRCLPMGYTDGMTTYLVTRRHLAEGGYEPYEAPLYFGLPAPLAPAAEQLILDEIAALVAPTAPARPGPEREEVTRR
ncbi:hypothetical protein KCQ71_21490 [Ruania sp. N2-46]|uniref:Neutral/alkaline non-lysosomal ceramidase, N-terminal n=1 Tax=Occultella gossypii TaxID=2800820 RepID=A0ABS7SEE3_9MICO|nr:hypothetical protein [Occultella gossypii]